MPKFYLRPAGDASRFSDLAEYPEQPADRPGFEWVEGEPPSEAQVYVQLPLGDQLNELFRSLSADLQADFAPLKAAIKLELDQARPDIARLIIERATIPSELEPLRQQMLAQFP